MTFEYETLIIRLSHCYSSCYWFHLSQFLFERLLSKQNESVVTWFHCIAAVCRKDDSLVLSPAYEAQIGSVHCPAVGKWVSISTEQNLYGSFNDLNVEDYPEVWSCAIGNAHCLKESHYGRGRSLEAPRKENSVHKAVQQRL